MDESHQSLEIEKISFREAVLKELKRQPLDLRREKSQTILEKLSHLKEFKSSHVVMFYVSMLEEVETLSLLQAVIKEGKTVTVPLVSRKSGLLVSVEIHDPNQDLEPGTYGIFEPKNHLIKPFDLSKIDFVIVPGIAFDRFGYRLGRGKGYYDRFLPTLPSHTFKVGLAFDFQVFDEIPKNELDVKMNQVITN